MRTYAQCHSRLSLEKKITTVIGPAFATRAMAGVPALDHCKSIAFAAQVESAHVLGEVSYRESFCISILSVERDEASKGVFWDERQN